MFVKKGEIVPTDFEIKMLREINGQPQEDMRWGAAMGHALEFLREGGYIRGGYACSPRLTEKGKEFLRRLDKEIKG